MNLRKAILALAALTLTTALQAASINYEVKVAGYGGAGWIKVKPELRKVLGGKVAYVPQHGGWVTDRVSGGESLRITITPSTRIERHCRVLPEGLFAGPGLVPPRWELLPLTRVCNVPRNPNVDNVYVAVVTEAGRFDKRVPFGSR